jgi:hypothetical protein
VSNGNNCNATTSPAFLPPTTVVVGTVLSTDAFPQPHKGEPITLTNTKISISVPASLIQTGVDAGLVTDGMEVPATLTLVLDGSGTTEGSHTYTAHQTVPIHVVNGTAQPLSATVVLPDTTWHPVSDTTDVVFSEKSMTIGAFLNIIGGVNATFDCKPAGTPQLIALSGQSPQPPTTTTETVAPESTPTTTAPAGSSTLPRTGGSVLFLLVFAAAALDLGVVLIAASRRRLVRRG